MEEDGIDSCNPGLVLAAILLATNYKCDLEDELTVTAETLAELAEGLQCACFTCIEVSAKTGQNVKEVFDMHMLFDKIIAVEAVLKMHVAKLIRSLCDSFMFLFPFCSEFFNLCLYNHFHLFVHELGGLRLFLL